MSNTTKQVTPRSFARRPSSRKDLTAGSRASRNGLPGCSDSISDGTWVTLAASTSCPMAVTPKRQAACGWLPWIAEASLSKRTIETLPLPASIWAI
ncbi:hypothetical protein ABIF76_006135 [Bradyrhizobium ottawaense]